MVPAELRDRAYSYFKANMRPNKEVYVVQQRWRPAKNRGYNANQCGDGKGGLQDSITTARGVIQVRDLAWGRSPISSDPFPLDHLPPNITSFRSPCTFSFIKTILIDVNCPKTNVATFEKWLRIGFTECSVLSLDVNLKSELLARV